MKMKQQRYKKREATFRINFPARLIKRLTQQMFGDSSFYAQNLHRPSSYIKKKKKRFQDYFCSLYLSVRKQADNVFNNLCYQASHQLSRHGPELRNLITASMFFLLSRRAPRSSFGEVFFFFKYLQPNSQSKWYFIKCSTVLVQYICNDVLFFFI